MPQPAGERVLDQLGEHPGVGRLVEYEALHDQPVGDHPQELQQPLEQVGRIQVWTRNPVRSP